MRPILLAMITAACWGIGGYFEKQGMLRGQLPAQVAIVLRTAIALIILGAVSLPHLKTLGNADARSILYLVIGGGIVAGSVGMLCFYGAIRQAPLSQVMPIAFTAPLFGALMGILVGGEPLSARVIVGGLMCVGGVAVLSAG